MTIEIKTIKCPRLNKHYRSQTVIDVKTSVDERIAPANTPDLEVFVQFGIGTIGTLPEGIMCDEYDTIDKCCRLDDEPCTYREWKPFK